MFYLKGYGGRVKMREMGGGKGNMEEWREDRLYLMYEKMNKIK